MFCFAPILPVISTQKFEIKYFEYLNNKEISIFIDEKIFATATYTFGVNVTPFKVHMKILKFIENDGFNTTEDFFNYFNESYTGKLIHWTDKRY